jgi:hypothetical protein
VIGLVVAVVIATPLRMRDVLHVVWRGLSIAGDARRTGALAFAKFWADVFRAILPEKGDRDDDEEVEEEDVLQATMTSTASSRSSSTAPTSHPSR